MGPAFSVVVYFFRRKMLTFFSFLLLQEGPVYPLWPCARLWRLVQAMVTWLGSTPLNNGKLVSNELSESKSLIYPRCTYVSFLRPSLCPMSSLKADNHFTRDACAAHASTCVFFLLR